MNLGWQSSSSGNGSASAGQFTSGQFEGQQEEMQQALRAINVVADRPMVRQAQRRVRQRSLEMFARRRQLRERIGMTLLGISLVSLLMTPLIWGSYNQIATLSQSLGWRHCADAECQVMYLTCWLLPITLVTLVIGLLRSRSTKSSRKLDSFVR